MKSSSTKARTGKRSLIVQMDNQTVWLSQAQMAMLFERDQSVISRHIRNVFVEGELEEKSNMQNLHIANSDKPVVFYNLDVIISVGYRVKSQRGTQFRQWATQRLKDYLVQGYAINQKRLAELGKIVQLIEQSGSTDGLQLGEAKGLLAILGGYTRSFVLLNQYDSHNLPAEAFNPNITYEIEYTEAKAAIAELKSQLMAKKEATELFGNEKDDSFSGANGVFYYPVFIFGCGRCVFGGVRANRRH